MNKVDRHMDICKGLNKIYEQKNHDYGDSFHDTFVEEGMAMARIRLSDKLGRFKKLTRMSEDRSEGFKNVPMVKDESIRDTLLDLANYAIMTVMEMDILTEEEYAENLLSLGKDSLPDMTSQFTPNFTNCGELVCPNCGNKLTFSPKIDKYICGQCGVMYAISAFNGAPEIGENPCKKCTYPGKETCTGCVDRYAWEKKQQRSDTNAVEAEPVDDDPCEICGKTVIDKAACCGCPERLEWEKRQRRSDASASEVEQADGR